MYPSAIKIDPVGKFSELNSKNAWNYFKAGRRRSYLTTELLNPFDEKLKESTGWSDEKIPKTIEKTPYKFKEVEFFVTTKPTTKRPGYAEIYDDIIVYLNFVLEECKKGASIKNIKTLDDTPHILVKSLIERVQGKGEEIIKEGVEQKIDYSESERLKEEKSSMLWIPTKRNTKELNSDNSIIYVRADKLSTYFKDEVIGPFETALKSLTGWGEKIPEETQDYWEQLGPHVFKVQSTPYPSTAYADVINRLIKENKKPEKSGDWIKILNDIEDKFTRKYSVKTAGKEKYVSVAHTLKTTENIKEEKTKMKVRQPISYYPMI
ncbi:MAG: hypothetical protein NTY20_00480 [Candidatus Aenigmarchaeota archaeon]|nr:hypothetical protein [Candidatus Aenigmarchaeota archaeon]